jgi:hypothetical protein
VFQMLPSSLDCPFLIAPSVFSNVYFARFSQSYLIFDQLILFWNCYTMLMFGGRRF